MSQIQVMALDAEAMKRAAKAVFVRANAGHLSFEKIESLWPSQDYLHWDGLAESAVRAYLDSVQPASEPGERERALEDAARVANDAIYSPVSDGVNIQNEDDAAYYMAAKISDAIRALSTASPPIPEAAEAHDHAPKRWLIEKTLPSGSIVWNVVEHEHDAREVAANSSVPAKITALYASPPPPAPAQDAVTIPAGLIEALRHQRQIDMDGTEVGVSRQACGRIDEEGKYVYYGDYVSDPRKCWLKPLADLTDEERAWMEECDRREADSCW